MDHQSMKQNIKQHEAIAAVILFALLMIGGVALLKPLIVVRLLIGIGFGYVLSRAFTGFAGSVNRACRTGSTQLMRTLAFLFFITSIVVAAFSYRDENFAALDLWINPINFGLIIGGIIFGFGMSLSSCCASGVMTDLAAFSPRAILTLVFFAIGVFVGFPVQATQKWIQTSWITSERGAEKGGGVFLADLFRRDGFNGYLGAIILTGVLCLIVYAMCMRYEKKRKASGRYTGVDTEIMQASAYDYNVQTAKFFSKDTYYHFFVKPFSLIGGAVGIMILFTVIMAVFKSEWGASTPYGLWIGRLLIAFGVSPEQVQIFAHSTQGGAFETPILEQAVSVQDLGIWLGAILYALLAGSFVQNVKAEWKTSGKEAALYILGGFTMGFGTRLANGCNAGALYSPIAAFSLSGWLFLPCMMIGGVIGNKFRSKVL